MTEANFETAKKIKQQINNIDNFLCDYIKTYNYHGNDTPIVQNGDKKLTHSSLGKDISEEIYIFTKSKIEQKITELQKEFNEL